jgi:hypothetical protein
MRSFAAGGAGPCAAAGRSRRGCRVGATRARGVTPQDELMSAPHRRSFVLSPGRAVPLFFARRRTTRVGWSPARTSKRLSSKTLPTRRARSKRHGHLSSSYNRHVPCPTQRLHALWLWVARNTAWCPPFSAKDRLKEFGISERRPAATPSAAQRKPHSSFGMCTPRWLPPREGG